MPIAYHEPDNSLDRAHKRITQMLIHQFPDAGLTEEAIESPDAAASVGTIIDMLDETIDAMHGFANDVEAGLLKASTTHHGYRQQQSLATANIETIGKIIRAAPVKIANFDATSITPVSLENINARLKSIRDVEKYIRDGVATVPISTMRPPRLAEANRMIAKVESTLEYVNALVQQITSKLAAASKPLTGGRLAYASNVF